VGTKATSPEIAQLEEKTTTDLEHRAKVQGPVSTVENRVIWSEIAPILRKMTTTEVAPEKTEKKRRKVEDHQQKAGKEAHRVQHLSPRENIKRECQTQDHLMARSTSRRKDRAAVAARV